MKKLFYFILICLTALICFSSCTDDNADIDKKTDVGKSVDMDEIENIINSYKYTDFELSDEVTDYVEIIVKDYGHIVVQLRGDIAPITVQNFKKLVEEDFYDNLIFHRVIKDFMIQGGGMYADGTYKNADTIKGEFSSNGVENNLLHIAGVISMARTSVNDSASSQFFIMHKQATHLDGEYAAFGYVLAGLDVVNSIAVTETDSSDRPLSDIVIESARFVKPIEGTEADDKYDGCSHVFGEWETMIANSCQSVGSEKRVCSACGKVETQETAKLSHTYGDWECIKESSCVESGEQKRVCSACGNEEVGVIEKLEHIFENGFCTMCNKYNFESGEKTESGDFDTSFTGSGVDIDMEKVKEQIGKYEYTDFVKSDDATDFVVIKVKDYGNIVIALRSDIAPNAVENFKLFISSGAYAGGQFYKVRKDDMILARKNSDVTVDGTEKKDSDRETDGYENNLLHTKGVISAYGDNGSFFIMDGEKTGYDGRYVTFGYVLCGLDVVDEIANAKATEGKPYDTITIEEIIFVSPKEGTGLGQ